MSEFSLPLKRKVKKIQNSTEVSEFTNTAIELLNNRDFYLDDEENISNSGNIKKLITVLKNHIKVLESTLQKTREESFKVGFEEGKDVTQSKLQRQIEDISEEFGAMARSLQYQYDKALEKMESKLKSENLLQKSETEAVQLRLPYKKFSFKN
ncbi:MAG: hypothetical protein ACE5HX_17370 [bacterium]